MIFSYIMIIIYIIFQIYSIILFGSVILSWIPQANNIKIFRAVNYAADWYLGNFKGKIVIGIFDFTTIIGFVVYQSITQLILFWI